MTLIERRRAKDLSLFEVAKQIGVKPADVSAWEHQRARPTDAHTKALAALYNCTPEDICNTVPTDEQEKENNEKMARFMAGMNHVFADAKTKGLKRGGGGASETKCPSCAGIISYSVASVNGHIHASCSTQGCVRFMQ